MHRLSCLTLTLLCIATAAQPSSNLTLQDYKNQSNKLEAFALAVDLALTAVDDFGLHDARTVAAIREVALASSGDSGQRAREMYYELATTVHENGDAGYLVATATYASMLRLRGRELARPYFEEIVPAVERYRESNPETYISVMHAYAHFLRSDAQAVDQSIALQGELVLLRERLYGAADPRTLSAKLWFAFTRFHRGDHANAMAILDEIEPLMREGAMAENWQLGTLLGMRGEMAILDDDLLAAKRYFEECGRLHKNARRRTPPGFGALAPHGYQYLAYIEARLGNFEAAFYALQKYREQASHELLSLLYFRRENSEAAHELKELETRVAALQEQRVLAEAQDLESTWPALLTEFAAIAARDRARRSVVDAREIESPTVQETLRHLPEGGALVGWLLTSVGNWHAHTKGEPVRHLWGYILRDDGRLTWVEMSRAPSPESGRRVFDLLSVAEMWRGLIDDDPALKQSLYEVAGEYWHGLEPLLSGIEEVIIEFSVEATAIPVEMLVASDRRYVSEQVTIAYTPCASVLVALGADPSRPPSELSALAFSPYDAEPGIEGDTRLPTHVVRSIVDGDFTAISQVPWLPGAAPEARAVAACFDDTRLTLGDAALEDSFFDLVVGRDVVHIPTHVFIDIKNAERSAILCAKAGEDLRPGHNGLLTGGELLYRAVIDAELVVLSGCQTGKGEYARGEPLGLYQTLFAAGARCVLASAWKVDDEATRILMTRFYQNWTGTYEDERELGDFQLLPKRKALNEARNYVRTYTDADGNTPFAHPIYWAGFTLIGDAR